MLIRQLPRRSVFAAVQPLLKQSSQALHSLLEPSVLGAYPESPSVPPAAAQLDTI